MIIQYAGQSKIMFKSLKNIMLLVLAFIVHLAYHLNLATYWLFTLNIKTFRERRVTSALMGPITVTLTNKKCNDSSHQ